MISKFGTIQATADQGEAFESTWLHYSSQQVRRPEPVLEVEWQTCLMVYCIVQSDTTFVGKKDVSSEFPPNSSHTASLSCQHFD